MRRSILIVICLCASVFLFSQQSFAALQPMADISLFFDQTGTWSGTPTGLTNGISTNWSSSGSGSWYLNPGSLNTGLPNYSPYYGAPDFTVTYNFTFTNETMDFYYNGTEYSTSGSGTGTLVFRVTMGAFNPTGSTFSINFSAGLHPINLTSNGAFTGYYINNSVIGGTIDNVDLANWPNPTYFSGRLTSLDGSIGTPIPGAVWLLGSGLLGLVGIRRKFTKN